tara:strand:+ start:125 stop:442 length:318 start_codon:yes stop_codon:yes gene_type:complete
MRAGQPSRAGSGRTRSRIALAACSIRAGHAALLFFLAAVFRIARTGTRWRDFHFQSEIGNWNMVIGRFGGRARDVSDRVWKGLPRDPDMEVTMINATNVMHNRSE